MRAGGAENPHPALAYELDPHHQHEHIDDLVANSGVDSVPTPANPPLARPRRITATAVTARKIGSVSKG